jgi:hypothetical protein
LLQAAAQFAALWVALLAAAPAAATSLTYCSKPPALSVAEQDRLLRFGAVIKQELEASGAELALIARSGLDLERFGVRYSHAGISLKASDNTPWSVRQLYYACDESRPLIFDQGIAGFVLGTAEPALGFVSLVLLPEEQSRVLARTALDRRQALQMLNTRYSANAYPFSLQYQNCNQWVLELLALSFSGLADSGGGRAQAQAWLKDQAYVPQVFEVGWRPLMWLAELSPWLHSDDHPPADLQQARFRVSMPESIDAFVRGQLPQARRIELCHDEQQVVIREGWEALPADCRPGPGDRVVPLR